LNGVADTGPCEKDVEQFWTPDAEPGLGVTLKSSELSWIGFFGDAESSTLAVLEEKCLELSDLSISKKCQNDHFDPRHISSRLPTLGELLDGWALETSVL
jgi:hypothetical protein